MLETRLQTDASMKKSFRYVLLEKHGAEWMTLAAGSRYLRDVETRYAMLELEALAIHYGVKQCHMYLAGLQHLDVITDHQPRKAIFNRKDLFEIDNDKLMKIKQELKTKYIFIMDYRKDDHHGVTDALIINPVDDPENESNSIMDFGRTAAFNGKIGIQDLNIRWLGKEAMKDYKYKVLHDALVSGFAQFRTKYGPWTKSLTNQYVRDFRTHWNQLSIEGRLVVLKNRIFIPEERRRLKELHKGRQGIARTLQNARQSVYCHGITRDVEAMCDNCKECQSLRSSNHKESLESVQLPERPFDVVSADLFYTGGRVFIILQTDCQDFLWLKQGRRIRQEVKLSGSLISTSLCSENP